MFTSESISDIQRVINEFRFAKKSIGFVPTMGALHEGHLSLVAQAKTHCDIVIVSIYVNPTQFNNSEDLQAYPKTLEKDLEKLRNAKCDIVFTPSDTIMYPEKSYLSIQFGELGEKMEGAFRPGHFNGVGQIVTKLFNIIQPDKAFFGQKDFQQLCLIKRLVKEFCFPLEVISVPIAREPNGLAMSSRNERLTPEQREEAAIFYTTLLTIKNKISLNHQLTFEEVKNIAHTLFKDSIAELEYIELVSDINLMTKQENYLSPDTVICIAGYIGNVRLIDNMYLIS